MPVDKKAPITDALNKLKDAHKAQDIPAIDTAMGELEKLLHAMSQEMYNQQQQAGANPNEQSGPSNNEGGDNVTDVDFEEVK